MSPLSPPSTGMSPLSPASLGTSPPFPLFSPSLPASTISACESGTAIGSVVSGTSTIAASAVGKGFPVGLGPVTVGPCVVGRGVKPVGLGPVVTGPCVVGRGVNPVGLGPVPVGPCVVGRGVNPVGLGPVTTGPCVVGRGVKPVGFPRFSSCLFLATCPITSQPLQPSSNGSVKGIEMGVGTGGCEMTIEDADNVLFPHIGIIYEDRSQINP